MLEQRGYNPKYPNKIVTWKIGEEVPEWLIDSGKVKNIDFFKGVELDIRYKNSGGFEIIDSAGFNILVSTKNEDDYICYGDNKIFSLTPKQLNLLYK